MSYLERSFQSRAKTTMSPNTCLVMTPVLEVSNALILCFPSLYTRFVSSPQQLRHPLNLQTSPLLSSRAGQEP